MDYDPQSRITKKNVQMIAQLFTNFGFFCKCATVLVWFIHNHRILVDYTLLMAIYIIYLKD